MSVRAQRERHEQLERERAVLQMRDAVVCVIAPAYVGRVGTSAVHEAVDEALAQMVAAGSHLGEAEQVKALWITCARRRLIDEQRSAESQHRDATSIDDLGRALGEHLRDDPPEPTEATRQEWRIREIFSVLRGDQRVWAEAWYDEVLSGSRPSGAQPRGLGEALGWSPSKTKSVSRRARTRMATFIDDRANGVICDERQALLDAVIMSGARRRGRALDEQRYGAALLHLAGCENCYAAYHTRQRSLLARCGAVLALPIDGLAGAAHALSAKLTCLGMNAYGYAGSILGRLGIGGAAAAGGSAATIGAKATAVCLGVVCAATAGGELVGVIPPIPFEPPQDTREETARPGTVPTTTAPSLATVAAAPSTAVTATTPTEPPAAPPTAPPGSSTTPAAASEAPPAPASQPSEPLETPGDLPPAAPPEPSRARTGSSSTSHTSSSSSAGGRSNCVPGSLGC